MKRDFRIPTLDLNQDASAQTETAARQYLEREGTAGSHRASLAFSALVAATLVSEKLGALYSWVALACAKRDRRGRKAEPEVLAANSNIRSSAVVFVFALSCIALHAQTGSAIAIAAAGNSSSFAIRASEEETLRQLNEKLLKAHDKADVTTLDQIESDDFTLAGDFGTVTKREHLDHVRLAGGQPEPVNRLIIPQQIRFYGDVALITETDHASGSGGAKSDYQTTSMWVRRGESWRIVHMHYSKLAEK